jgi:plasmid stabilization system protein ParE
MSRYRFTPQAETDLLDIWSFIARDNREAADGVEEAIFQSCSVLADMPLAGQVRSDLTRFPLRFWVVQPYSKYLIVYDPATGPIRIIRLLHGARDLPSILK